jgi:hypothetical protein
VEQGLPLPWPAIERADRTVFSDLRNMTADGTPAFDLPFIIHAPPSQVVTTIPLKPAARVFLVKPAIFPPD